MRVGWDSFWRGVAHGQWCYTLTAASKVSLTSLKIPVPQDLINSYFYDQFYLYQMFCSWGHLFRYQSLSVCCTHWRL